MFTGIVQGTGKILDISGTEVIRMVIDFQNVTTSNLEKGASVAIDGVCLTVVSQDSSKVSFVLIPGSSEPGTSTAESLFTLISNKTLPSPIILGVTVNAKAASLNSVVVVPSAVV